MKNIFFFLFFIFQGLCSSTWTTCIPNFKTTIFIDNFSEYQTLKNLQNSVLLADNLLEILYTMTDKKSFQNSSNNTNLIFQYYPTLQQKIPHISLGTFPTPVHLLKNLGKYLGHDNLFIKRDDLSGKLCENGKQLFGGNKVRKLEFLFAEVLRSGCRSVLTWGVVGSYHAVATACYAHLLGLRNITMVKPEPNSYNVRKNLKLLKYFNAEIRPCPNNKIREIQTLATLVEQKYLYGDVPYFIPTGGSIPVGIVGFVNAAFELKKQISEGILPEPDIIYIPAGSWGSATGLLLGLKAAQLKTKIKMIAVEPEEQLNEHLNYAAALFKTTNAFLHDCDNTFPVFKISPSDFTIIHDFTGSEYGLFTKEGLEAKKIMKEEEDINLDGTYTAKTVAAMLYDIKNMKNKNKVILYWHTYCSDSFDSLVETIDYKELPLALHHYFKEPVQQFDQ